MAAETTKPAPKTKFTDANANSLSDRLLRLELLETNLAQKLAEMPYAKPVHTELTQLISDAKRKEFEIQSAEAVLRQAKADRKAMMQQGDKLRSRLASALSFEHGSTSVLLKEFGVRPRNTSGRKKKTAPPPTPDPTPAPPPQPEAQAQPGAQAAVPAKG